MGASVIEKSYAGIKAIEKFKEITGDYNAGRLDAGKFKAARLGMGLYTQRQSEFYMLRTKIAAGILDKKALLTLADAAQKYSDGSIHLTTRQDIQFYFVKHDDAVALLEELGGAGIISLGAGGNTIRNIITCDHHEDKSKILFDVAEAAKAVSDYFLGHELSSGLPRKFKITFCGQSSGCGVPLTDDMGAIAALSPEGAPGFKIYVGGGLGAVPRLGRLLEDFVPTDRIHEVILTILKIFNRHGSRVNRNRARIKFLIGKIGFERFKYLYLEEKSKLAELNPLELDFDCVESQNSKNDGESLVIRIPTGDLTSDNLRAIYDLLKDNGPTRLGATRNADLHISGIAKEKLSEFKEKINSIGFEAHEPMERFSVISCNGASTCNEGITNSKALAKRLEKLVSENGRGLNLRIGVGGCPNACGHHHTADIGLQGSAKRINGVLVPHYQVYIGGSVAPDPKFGTVITRIPAKNAIEAMKRLTSLFGEEKRDGESINDVVTRLGAEWFGGELKRYTSLGEYEDDKDSYLDFDSDTEFSMEDVGPGECAGAALDIIDGYFDMARRDMAAAKNESDDNAVWLRTHDAAIASAKALLVTYGVDPESDEETAREFYHKIITRGFVPENFRNSLEDIDPADGTCAERIERTDKFIEVCLAAYTRINAKTNVDEEEHEEAQMKRMDLTGVACPFNYTKIKLALEELPSGARLEAILDDGSPIINVPKSLINDGHTIVSKLSISGQYLLLVEKG